MSVTQTYIDGMDPDFTPVEEIKPFLNPPPFHLFLFFSFKNDLNLEVLTSEPNGIQQHAVV